MIRRYGPTLAYHEGQRRFWEDETRFQVVAAGRRSGKTLIAKKKLVQRVTRGPHSSWYVAAAPTHLQAKRIFWDDLKRMSRPFLDGKPRESDLSLRFWNGSVITVLGVDAPDRIEGSNRLQGIIGDEFASWKPDAWEVHISPALSDRGLDIPGWAILFGVPEGRNHFYRLSEAAQHGGDPEWSYHHWPSWEVLDPAEVEKARSRMDERTFQQELGAQFLDQRGRAYYAFRREDHVRPTQYNPELPLHICFDWNVDPGVALVIQEQDMDDDAVYGTEPTSVVLDEVWIRDSNTQKVCDALKSKWANRHRHGSVYLYGDAAGHSRSTQGIAGSDWFLVERELGKVWQRGHWDRRLFKRVPKANPPVRSRINVTNTRIRTADGLFHVAVDPACTRLIADLEGVVRTSAGEIDKKKDPALTHLSDALGYYLFQRFAVKRTARESESWYA